MKKILAAVLMLACGNDVPYAPHTDPPPDQSGKEELDSVGPSARPIDAGTNKHPPLATHRKRTTTLPDDASQLDRLRAEAVTSARLISGRTLSLKVWLQSGNSAVFKPIRRTDQRAGREVAAFRISRLLGIDGVPVSTMRKVPLHRLVALIEKRNPAEAKQLLKTADVDDRGNVSGAIIQWIEGLDPNGLKAVGGVAGIEKWLAPPRPMADEPSLAKSAAAMVVFDYLIGNWDRFSGGNLFLSQTGGLVLLDHNGSFAPWSNRQQQRMRKRLSQTMRFSAALVECLRGLREEDVAVALAQEPHHLVAPLISAAEMALLFERRDRLLAHIDNLIERHGISSVLAFP
ncbi:MAG: hypothetical protein QNJ97_05260 [Myxococcota bacterium]|nr:hypothetical protein [Myxococcota bacterium]